ncbi:ABC transporter permease [Aureibacillus halotolerans]|uniref:ABC-2 family transporter n=1 Tax=Aureibacillus halotolerans TaxID=1508390 RepID=A0A4R6U724_9BACI|nr:ABC transporter permease [Aureibacillus halotolerans]TDQ40345.1 ABC-2 family transporter [Aureibacillus halotolerans]
MTNWLLRNPVLQKEFKLRFRTKKSFFGIAVYVTVMAGILLPVLYMFMNQYGVATYQPEESRWLFLFLTMLQLALIIFVVPGLTSSAISGERERQTLNILLTTNQSSFSIIIGKLFSSLAFMTVLIVSTMPLYTILFLYGGISPNLLWITFGMFVLTMVSIGAVGIMASTLIRKTIVATITTYAISFFLALGPVITLFIYFMGVSMPSGSAQNLSVFPLFISSISIPLMLFETFGVHMITEMVGQTGRVLPTWQPWAILFSFYGLLIIGSLFVATARLRPRSRMKK